MPKIQASPALSRFKVLDLSRVRAGPNCVRILTDFGADVIRVEPPAGVDPNEAMFAANRKGGDFQNINRNKRSMTLNLKKDGAMDILKKMIATADVLVENWRPDVKARLGLDYESLKAINPRIILASISGFGQDGPYGKRPGFDQIAQGMGGLMSVTGEPGQGPMRVGIAVSDMASGLYMAFGILLALLGRELVVCDHHKLLQVVLWDARGASAPGPAALVRPATARTSGMTPLPSMSMSLKAKRRMRVSRGMLVLPAKCATPTGSADATQRGCVSACGR